LGRVKVFEFHHRSHQPFEASMVLRKPIVQTLALAKFIPFVVGTMKLMQTCLMGTALVNVDQTRATVFIDGFFQKP
jgi:hypothetical protein